MKENNRVLIWYKDKQDGDVMTGAFGTLVKVKGKVMGKIGKVLVQPEIIVEEHEEKI